MATEDVTPDLQRVADSVDTEAHEASDKLKARRPPLNFAEMGIPVGAELVFTQNPSETVHVISERKVNFRGQPSSLTAATATLLEISYQVAPGPYWLFQGRHIRDIYNDTSEAL